LVVALASGSKIEIICKNASGGTGTASWEWVYIPNYATGNVMTTGGDLIYGGTNGVQTRLANGTLNQVLKSAGGTSAPSWTYAALGDVQTKTTTYTALVSDGMINCSGSAFTVTLFAASGNAGKVLTITKTDSSLTNIITIDANASETINGSLTTTLNTQYESVTLYCDGSNWFIRERRIPSFWTSWTPTGSWVTNATYTGFKRRTGDSMEYDILVTCSGAPTSAALTVTILETIDTTKLTLVNGNNTELGILGVLDSGVANYSGRVVYSSTTSVAAVIENASGTYTTINNVTQAAPITFGASDSVHLVFKVPISGWNG
jgi:hypothetical protein